MDYPLEDSLEHLTNKTFLDCFKYALRHKSMECGGYFVIDNYTSKFEFVPLINDNNYNSDQFLSKDGRFYKDYVSGSIISLFHSHLIDDPKPSKTDLETSHSFALPSFIFSVKSKLSFLSYPTNYKPPSLSNRFFVPSFQDCMIYVKDYLQLNFDINLNQFKSNWSRRRDNPNYYLFEFLNNYFDEVPSHEFRNGDIFVFDPSLYSYNHLGIVDQNEYLMHHPVYMLPLKELITSELLNKVYKVYRYKDS